MRFASCLKTVKYKEGSSYDVYWKPSSNGNISCSSAILYQLVKRYFMQLFGTVHAHAQIKTINKS